MKKELSAEDLIQASQMERDSAYILNVSTDNTYSKITKNIFYKIGKFVNRYILLSLMIAVAIQIVLNLLNVTPIIIIATFLGMLCLGYVSNKIYLKGKEKLNDTKVYITKNRFKKPENNQKLRTEYY